MAKKENDALDELAQKGEQAVKRRAKSKVKKLHPTTKVLMLLFLVAGIAVGAFVCMLMSKNDRFVLKGDTQFEVDASTGSYLYCEQGSEAVCFGLDVSSKVKVEASLGITMDEDGHFIIPAEEGIYTLTYTVDALKFNGTVGGEPIKRIRVFVVSK